MKPFIAGANPSESWRFWRQDFLDFMEAADFMDDTERKKTAVFRHVCGEELKTLYRTMSLKPSPPEKEITLDQILTEFDRQFEDYQNEIYASFLFLEIKQKQGEKFQEFFCRLKLAVEDCNYGTNSDRMLRDKIIHGLQDKPLQERLLRETSRRPKTLHDIVTECRAAEQSRSQALAMNEHNDIYAMVSNHRNNHLEKYDSCRNCGRSHEPRNCPAFNTTCKNCGKKSHWAEFCRSKAKPFRGHPTQSRRVHALEPDSDLTLGELTINEVSTPNEKEWSYKMLVNGTNVNFKLDTGAQVNVLPICLFDKLKEQPNVRPYDTPILDYNKSPIPVIGVCTLLCKSKFIRNPKRLEFLITSLNSSAILGLQACENLGLIKRMYNLNTLPTNPTTESSLQTVEEIMEEFKDVFTGIGRLNRKVSIRLKPNAVPHIAAPRKIPLALHEKVKQELTAMESQGIIVKVEEPTDWVSNMVVVDSPKKLRICIDPRPLNEAIRRPHYPIPTTERLFTNLQGCTVFSLLDAKNGFWQLPLDNESSYLTTFTTPWGRYRFLVLPFGLNNAPEEFQRAMEEIFENEPQIQPYFDDIALSSKNNQEHCILLKKALTIARKANLTFNPSKAQIAKSSINYLGHIISKDGIQPDSIKVQGIQDFPTPKNKEELQRFLGMVTYQSKFTNHLSDLTHSLRQLLRKNTAFIWDSNMQRDFEIIKKALVEAPCLSFFDNAKPVRLSVDASQNGLGAVLMQEGRPVAYASAALTEAQKRYAQIEKELLAIIFGLEKFNYFTYGRHVEVETDHKPLLGLSKRYYEDVTPRLQRMLLRMGRYDVTLNYVPGKQLVVADALSRATSSDIFEESLVSTSSVYKSVQALATAPKWQQISDMTAKDCALKAVSQYVKEGWPEEKAKVNLAATPFWHCRNELYLTEEGILCRGKRVIIPDAARLDTLNKLHTAHRGIVACKAKAREYLYWPMMNQDIENFIGKCEICQKYQKSNQQEPLIERSLPERPWQIVAGDFLSLNGITYMLLIDYFSKYIEVQHMHGTSTSAVVNAMKAAFARHGIPEEFVSDGGPPFNGEMFQTFLTSWNIAHHKTSPHFPRSNGQVERAVQTFKNGLKKAKEEGKDLHLVLLDYRITPANGLKSPAELLMGRRLRSFIPSHSDNLLPNFNIKEEVEQLRKNQLRQNHYANQGKKTLPELEVNQQVWFRLKPTHPWQKARIVDIGPNPRTYKIVADNGKTYVRNRFYLRPCKDPSISKAEPSTTVEDYCSPAFEDTPRLSPRMSSPHQSLSRPTTQAANNPSTTTTRSGRTVRQPIRYGT